MNARRRMVIITDGYNNPHTAKTAICLIRYRPAEVVAVLDRPSAGKTAQEVFGLGGGIPFVGSLAEAAEANTLVIGIAPPGGKFPPHWRPIILEAIARSMTVVSGLHELLRNDAEFRRAAEEHGVQLVDVRENDEHDVAQPQGSSPRLPPHPHDRQRLQLRQDGGGRRAGRRLEPSGC